MSSWNIGRLIRKGWFREIKTCCWICLTNRIWRQGEQISSWEWHLVQDRLQDPSTLNLSSTIISKRQDSTSQLASIVTLVETKQQLEATDKSITSLLLQHKMMFEQRRLKIVSSYLEYDFLIVNRSGRSP